MKLHACVTVAEKNEARARESFYRSSLLVNLTDEISPKFHLTTSHFSVTAKVYPPFQSHLTSFHIRLKNPVVKPYEAQKIVTFSWHKQNIDEGFGEGAA